MTFLPLVTLLLSSLMLQPSMTNAPDHVEREYGTVNIFLAVGTTLVAVTDSMLTSMTGQHSPTGTKLYKLDHRTICAIAGLYSDPGPDGFNRLAVVVPEIIRDISVRETRRNFQHASFADRAGEVAYLFSHQLTSHLQAMVANSMVSLKDEDSTVELTIAGYDEDGTLKLAEITLKPSGKLEDVHFVSARRKHGLANPICELRGGTQTANWVHESQNSETSFVIRSVGDEFFCEVAGIQDVAENLLNLHPRFLGDSVEQRYYRAPKAGEILSPDDLEKLAVGLERRTEEDEAKKHSFLVGGDVEVAVLSNGMVVEDPPTLTPQDVGQSLRVAQVLHSTIHCESGALQRDFVGPPFSQLQMTITDCTQPLDEIIFHDSTFIDSTLTYMGSQPLIFADSNQIVRSTLQLGPAVDLNNPKVKHLVCAFRWKGVYQQSKQVSLDCR